MISAIGPIAGVTETEVSEAIGAIVAVMTDAGPHRLVIASNVVVFSDDELTGEFADVGAEHRRNLAILRDSALDWTALAPELLRDDGADREFRGQGGGAAPRPDDRSRPTWRSPCSMPSTAPTGSAARSGSAAEPRAQRRRTT